MPAAQVMKIRQVSFEYIGKDEEIDLFFKAAINDYLKLGNLAKNKNVAFVGCVENLSNKANFNGLDSYQ